MFTVYKVTNKLNAKSYVGFTSRSKEGRWKVHQQRAILGAKTHFHCALRKYGAENFKLETLEEGWNSEIGKNIREPYWISVLRPEYNHTRGGDGTLGSKRSEEWRQRTKANGYPFEGRKHTEKSKKIQSERKIGNHLHTGYTHSDNTKRIMSDKKKGIPHQIVTCPYCSVVGGIAVMHRWHFDNCNHCS